MTCGGVTLGENPITTVKDPSSASVLWAEQLVTVGTKGCPKTSAEVSSRVVLCRNL